MQGLVLYIDFLSVITRFVKYRCFMTVMLLNYQYYLYQKHWQFTNVLSQSLFTINLTFRIQPSPTINLFENIKV